MWLYICKSLIIFGGNVMIQLAFKKEPNNVKSMPQEAQEVIAGILEILDREYGADRNKYEDDGGYVVIVEKQQDFKEIKDKTYIDCDNVIAEYVEKIICSNGEIYANSLILCNNDYAISLIIPLELTQQNFKNYIIA